MYWLIELYLKGRLAHAAAFCEERGVNRGYLVIGWAAIAASEAAQRAAMIYTLLDTCIKHQVTPFQWLRDVLTRLPDHLIQQVSELLPYRWKSMQ